MANHRIFTAFAIEDKWARDYLVGQARNDKSPFEFELPGDGTYGLVLVVSTASHPGEARLQGIFGGGQQGSVKPAGFFDVIVVTRAWISQECVAQNVDHIHRLGA